MTLRDLPPDLARPASALLAIGAAFKPATPVPAWLVLELAQLGLPDDARRDQALAWLVRHQLVLPTGDGALLVAPDVAYIAYGWLPGYDVALLVEELVSTDMAGRLMDAVAADHGLDPRLLPHARHLADGALARKAPFAPMFAAALGHLLLAQGQGERAEQYLRAALKGYEMQGVPVGEEEIVASALGALGAVRDAPRRFGRE